MTEFAGHLPGLPREAIGWRHVAHAAWGREVEIALPQLDAGQAGALCGHVREQGRRVLHAMETGRIVAAIDQAVARLLDRSHPVRAKADELLPVVTGHDPETVGLALTSYLKSFRAPQLRRFLAEDFRDPGMLDAFRPAPKGGLVRAQGPELLLHVWAGNVPALSLWSLICGLLVKAGTIGKVASAEPLMAGWFAGLLAEIDPELGACLAILGWKGGQDACEPVFLREADTVMAYGTDATLTALRDRLPVSTRFLGHGHRIGFAMIAREALDSRKAPALARLAAQDIVRWEQQGCYSPQAIFVERGGPVAPAVFARHLAQELAALAYRHPRRALAPAEANALAQWRGRQEIAAAAGESELLGQAGASWGVAHAEAGAALLPSGLNRTVRTVALDDLAEVAGLVAPHRRFLQTAGLAASPERLLALSEQLAAAGVTRIAALGRMTAPEAGWHHDGRFSLLDLVSFCEIEQGAETAAEGFAAYVD